MEPNQKKPGSAAVDEILNELKGYAAAPPKGNVDDILAEMGLGAKRSSFAIPKAPAAAPKAPAAPGTPAPPRVNAVKPAPAPAAAPKAPAVPGTPASPQVSAAKPAPAPTAAPKAPAAAPGTPAPPQVNAVKPAPAAAPKAPAVPGTPAAPVDLFGEEAASRQKKVKTGTMIWDIEPEHEELGPRMGKAAALERVEPDKFVGDSELNRWFERDSGFAASKSERRRAEKEMRKRLAEERKEEKRRARLDKRGRGTQTVIEEEVGFAGVAPRQGGNAFFEEEPAPAPPARPAAAPRYDNPSTAEFAAAMQAPAAPAARAETPAVKAPAAVPGTPAPLQANAAKPAAPAAKAEAPAAEAPAPGKPPSPALSPSAAFAAAMQAKEEPREKPRRAARTDAADVVTGSAFDEPADAWERGESFFDGGKTTPLPPAAGAPKPAPREGDEGHDTQSFDLGEDPEAARVPTAAYTQEFETAEGPAGAAHEDRSLFLDDMVDDRFRQFFSETVIVEKAAIEAAAGTARRKKKKSRSALLTGEFTQLAEMVEQAEAAEMAGEDVAEEEAFEDYDRPQDAEAIEGDIAALRRTLTRRGILSAVCATLLLWLGLSFSSAFPVPAFMNFSQSPYVFCVVYLGLLALAIGVNFTTFTTGIVGLFGASTVDSAPALACLAALIQGGVLLVQAILKVPAQGTLFGFLAALALCCNAVGKRIRAVSILNNFQLASAGTDHSAAYVLDSSTELAYNITKGLEEEDPALLVSRPTTLVKGFLRQSFSQRGTDRTGRILGWVILGAGLAATALGAIAGSQTIFGTVSAFAAVLCIAAPLSSSLVSGVPASQLQKSTARLGAVVPGWSAIEELGRVNVVMAGARDIFPPSVVYLKGIKTFEKERIDLAILYAASVLIEGSDTLKDIFMGVIQGKQDMLYQVESLTKEPGRGFTAWVQNNRIVIGSREMLQKHDVAPPPIELEMKYIPDGHMPIYLAVGGKLFAMFIVGYGADLEVRATLNGLIRSGVSLLVTNGEINISGDMIEHAYRLPHGVVKVLGQRELDILHPLTRYIPESEGVMTHIGTFASFIGGMRAAAGCAASEKMSSIVQAASVALAAALCLLMAFGGNLASLAWYIPLLYQGAWTLLVCVPPLMRRY